MALFFFSTRRTREGKYLLRALQVGCAIWVLLIGEENGISRSD
jgi:hypothetical protein